MIARKQQDDRSREEPASVVHWHELATESPYRTAVAVRQALHQGNLREAAVGMQELIDALARSDKRALKNQLIRLMTHVIKWQSQPAQRSRSWRATINNARREIRDIQEDTPSLTRDVIEAMWDACFEAALDAPEAEMDQETAVASLSWEGLFEAEYGLAAPRRQPRKRRTRRPRG